MEYYQLSIRKVLKALKTNQSQGLTIKEAQKRLARQGPNLLPVAHRPPLIFKFLAQFKNLLVMILILATAVSAALGDLMDAAAIATIVVINATIGFIQEVKAEKTLESLKQKGQLYALVMREKSTIKIPVADIVPGDILVLEEGNKIAADARIIESFSLRVDEAILTGESQTVTKNAEILPSHSVLADRKNMVYKDTQITSGRAKALVTATGAATEIGRIAKALETTEEIRTPLTLELESVARALSVVIGLIALLIFILNFLQDITLVESLLISISLAVAAIPEGLPAIVTVVLSIGVKRLAERKTIVKKLPAVETLGAIRMIATDKTGTLTENKINVTEIISALGKKFTVEGIGYEKIGTFYNEKGEIINPDTDGNLINLLNIGVLASNAQVAFRDGKKNKSEVMGDTTEGALLVAAARANINPVNLRRTFIKIFEVPFTSERKMMSVVVKADDTDNFFLYAKGAPEVMLDKCRLSAGQKRVILATTQGMAARGLRTLLFAQRKITQNEYKKSILKGNLKEKNFVYSGLMGMQDPLRREVKEALELAREAGIKTIMVTGDHAKTAEVIAREAGIYKSGDELLTEEEVQKLSQKELAGKIRKNATVFARISPMSKLKIIQAIKSIPHTQVAVTGDGVNDAPALKAAHIGVAMGLTGTDITREVADVVITDDNYATIVDAVREGRIIFANLVKFIRYLISCNISEVIVVAMGVLMGTPAVLLPIQILWINLITDGFPALALGVDPPEYDVMKHPPRSLEGGILHKKRWVYMTIEGSIMGLTTLGLFLYALNYFDYNHAQTMAFTTLAFAQLTHAFNNRSTRKSVFEIGLFGNKPLVFAVLISVILQIMIVQTKLGNTILQTIALDWNDWLLVACFSLLPLLVVEIKKQLRFRILP